MLIQLKDSFRLIQKARNEIKPRSDSFFLLVILTSCLPYIAEFLHLPYLMNLPCYVIFNLYIAVVFYYSSKDWDEIHSYQLMNSFKLTRCKGCLTSLIPYFFFLLIIHFITNYCSFFFMKNMGGKKFYPYSEIMFKTILSSLLLTFNEFTLPLIIEKKFIFKRAFIESWRITFKNIIPIFAISNFFWIGSFFMSFVGLGFIFLSEKVFHSSYTIYICILFFIFGLIWVGYFLSLIPYLQYFLYKTYYRDEVKADDIR